MSFINRIINRLTVKTRTIMKPIIVVKPSSELLQGKTALITGGSGGIGAAIGKELKNAGANVILVGRNEKMLQKVSNELNCLYAVINICNIKDTTDKIEKIFKDTPIDILVNSAGIHGNDPFGEVKEETFDSVIETNVKALYFISQSVANQMIRHGIKGHILNVSSASALKPSWTPYEISKRAVNGITQGMAHKLIQHGIIVNGIAPGPTSTSMLRNDGDISWSYNPSGRMSTPDEIASLALFMVSPQGDGIVGDTFFLTGGSGTIDKEK